MGWKRILGWTAWIAFPTSGWAASAGVDLDRADLQDHDSEQREQALSLFGSAPVEHIVPRRDRITFALALDYFDVTVVPRGQSAKSPGDHKLEMSGMTGSPYVAFSTNQLGIGFAGEYGKLEAHYLRKTDGSYLDQYGELKYSGLGIFGYLIPNLRFMPRFITPTVMLGGKKLIAVHQSTGDLRSAYAPRELNKFSYDVFKWEAGIDLGIDLVRSVTIMPWLNYILLDVGAPKTENEQVAVADHGLEGGGTYIVNSAIISDQDLFWRSAPSLTYGIDFSVRLGRFDVHLGGLLGLVGNLVKGSERVASNSLSLGVSYDFKGS